MEETASTSELAMMAGMALTPIEMARASEGGAVSYTHLYMLLLYVALGIKIFITHCYTFYYLFIIIINDNK